MRAIHWAIIFVALILTCLWFMFTLPSKAAECIYSYDDVIASFATDGTKVFQIPADRLPKVLDDLKAIDGIDRKNVTRAFIASDGSTLYLGIEQDGCLLPAIPLGPAVAPSAHVQPGASKTGTGA